jgi:hypothetical protein
MGYRRRIRIKERLNSFRRGGPRRIDEKKLDFQAAFLGHGRLIDVREGPMSG